MFFPCGFFFYLSSVSLWSPYGIGRPLYFRRVKKAKIPHSTKFSGDQLTIAGDVPIFQNGGRRHLGFSKFQNFDRKVMGSNCVKLPNFVSIGQTVTEIWRFFDFSRWRPQLSRIFKVSKF